MIFFSEDLYIGEGNERICFSYPGENDKCIKITKNKKGVRQEQSIVEMDYYDFLNKKNIPLTHLPKCYGWVTTNLGQGLVFEKIEREPEKGALSLKKALEDNIIDKKDARIMVDEVYDYLIRYGIVLADINSENFLVKINERRLYLVDGVGGRNFDMKYKIRKRFATLSNYKTKRQWKKYSFKLGV